MRSSAWKRIWALVSGLGGNRVEANSRLFLLRKEAPQSLQSIGKVVLVAVHWQGGVVDDPYASLCVSRAATRTARCAEAFGDGVAYRSHADATAALVTCQRSYLVKVSDTFLADLESTCRDPLEALSPDDVEGRPKLGTPSIVALLQGVSSSTTMADKDELDGRRHAHCRRKAC